MGVSWDRVLVAQDEKSNVGKADCNQCEIICGTSAGEGEPRKDLVFWRSKGVLSSLIGVKGDKGLCPN